jgi:hypothetical protein
LFSDDIYYGEEAGASLGKMLIGVWGSLFTACPINGNAV